MEAVINGRSFEVGPEPADFWGWVKDGRYDREWKLLDAYLTPKHTFLDLGAWIGSHSLYASTIAKRVIAIEPDPVACEILFSNVDDAPCPVEVYRVAITGHEGAVTLGSGLLGASTTRKNAEAGGGIGAWAPGQTFEVNSTTLRAFVDKHKLEDPLFIKMDVEGSEEDILADVEFFKERKPILYLETHPFWWGDELRTRDLIRQVSETCQMVTS